MSQHPAKSYPAGHRLVLMPMPRKVSADKRLSPFSKLAIEMKADPLQALVYDRTKAETRARAAAMCGGAIRAAMRRDPSKAFEVRPIVHRGLETYAIWRVK